jgi:hypothetical protein
VGFLHPVIHAGAETSGFFRTTPASGSRKKCVDYFRASWPAGRKLGRN